VSNRTQDPMRPPFWHIGLRLAGMSPRCSAHVRSGARCLAPAMANGCCRMHGGGSTGPRTPDGVERLRASRTIHGWRGVEASQFRQMLRTLRAETRRLRELV
jgi:hypothetical protein